MWSTALPLPPARAQGQPWSTDRAGEWGLAHALLSTGDDAQAQGGEQPLSLCCTLASECLHLGKGTSIL